MVSGGKLIAEAVIALVLTSPDGPINWNPELINVPPTLP